MLARGSKSWLVFGFGLALACQSRPLHVPEAADAASDNGAGSVPVGPDGGAGAPACAAGGIAADAGAADAGSSPLAPTCGPECDRCSNGRCVRVLASSSSPGPLALTSSEVIWADYARDQPAAILKVSSNGGMPQTLAVAPAGTTVNSLAIDSDYAYWTQSSSVPNPYPPMPPPDGAVMKTPIAGGASTAVASV